MERKVSVYRYLLEQEYLCTEMEKFVKRNIVV